MESLEAEHDKLKESVESLANKKRETRDRLPSFRRPHKDQVHRHLQVYGKLESVGIGLKELKLFHNSVKEIAVANHIHEKDAYNKFYADVAQRRRVWPWM